MSKVYRYCVVRYPDPGLPALAGPPNDFPDERSALARIAQIEGEHLKAHHTSLGVVSYQGSLYEALDRLNILY